MFEGNMLRGFIHSWILMNLEIQVKSNLSIQFVMRALFVNFLHIFMVVKPHGSRWKLKRLPKAQMMRNVVFFKRSKAKSSTNSPLNPKPICLFSTEDIVFVIKNITATNYVVSKEI